MFVFYYVYPKENGYTSFLWRKSHFSLDMYLISIEVEHWNICQLSRHGGPHLLSFNPNMEAGLAYKVSSKTASVS